MSIRVETHRTKNVHYRKARFLKHSEFTLQELIESAFIRNSNVKSRLKIRGENSIGDQQNAEIAEKEFINTHISKFGVFFGNLLKYEAGANKHTLTVDDNAKECDVEQLIPPKTKTGKRREFLDSILYFAIFRDHVVVLQSIGLTTTDLENHLNWLLRHSGLFDEQRVYLNQEVSEEAKTKILESPTKKLKMMVPALDGSETPVLHSTNATNIPKPKVQAKNIKFQPRGRFLDVLKAAGFMNESNKELFNEVTKGTNLDVTVEVSYNRVAKKDTQKLINNISHTLRHSDIENFEVEFKGAGKLKGNKLIISTKISFKYVNGLLEPEDFYRKVHDWIQMRVRDGVLAD